MPPVELTEEEKTKFTEHLKELGYDDHAKSVIERVNREAKTHREKAEQLEKELEGFRKSDADRKAADERRKADEEAARKKIDDEKKTLDQRLADMRKEIAEQSEAATRAQKAEIDALVKQIKERDEKLEKRDARLVSQAVRAAARERGIIDLDLVDLLDTKAVKVEDGEVDSEAVEKLIDEHAKAKPHLYKEPSQRDRDDQGRFARPDPARKAGKQIAWEKLGDKEFEEQEERLRSGRL